MRGNEKRLTKVPTICVWEQINLVVDPEAAKIVLTADFPNITIVGNVANVLLPTVEYLDEIAEVENPFSLLTRAHYPLFGLPFWDETAAAIMVDPSIVTEEIECEWFRVLDSYLGLKLTLCKFMPTSTHPIALRFMATSGRTRLP